MLFLPSVYAVLQVLKRSFCLNKKIKIPVYSLLLAETFSSDPCFVGSIVPCATAMYGLSLFQRKNVLYPAARQLQRALTSSVQCIITVKLRNPQLQIVSFNHT